MCTELYHRICANSTKTDQSSDRSFMQCIILLKSYLTVKQMASSPAARPSVKSSFLFDTRFALLSKGKTSMEEQDALPLWRSRRTFLPCGFPLSNPFPLTYYLPPTTQIFSRRSHCPLCDICYNGSDGVLISLLPAEFLLSLCSYRACGVV